jgi:hypothetical protein
MNIGKARAVFLKINSEDYTDEEKATAIYYVLKMPTHNGINKDSLLTVIKYLFDAKWEVTEVDNK